MHLGLVSTVINLYVRRYLMSLVMSKPAPILYEQQDIDQPAFSHRLFSTLVVRCLISKTSLDFMSSILRIPARLCRLPGRFEADLGPELQCSLKLSRP